MRPSATTGGHTTGARGNVTDVGRGCVRQFYWCLGRGRLVACPAIRGLASLKLGYARMRVRNVDCVSLRRSATLPEAGFQLSWSMLPLQDQSWIPKWPTGAVRRPVVLKGATLGSWGTLGAWEGFPWEGQMTTAFRTVPDLDLQLLAGRISSHA